MRISDWSSDVCSSDLIASARDGGHADLIVGASYPPSPVRFDTQAGDAVQGARELDALVVAAPTLACRMQRHRQNAVGQGRAARQQGVGKQLSEQARMQRSEERRVGKECGSRG